jgi:hypothetical protein
MNMKQIHPYQRRETSPLRLQMRRQIGQKQIKHRFYSHAHRGVNTSTGRSWNRQQKGKDSMWTTNEVGGKQHLQPFPAQQFPGQQFPLPMLKANEKSGSHGESSPSPMIRVAWLKQPGRARAKSARLFTRFSNAGMKISIVEVSGSHTLLEQILGFDLILMEYFDHLEHEIHSALSKIRTESRAPLMMLTDSQTPEWSVNALKAGADAIFNLNTPEDIILARCNALLRRWLAQS